MGGKLEDNGFSLKDRPKVFVVMGKWHPDGIGLGDEDHIIGIFDDEVAANKEAEDALTAESPRAQTWVALFFLR